MKPRHGRDRVIWRTRLRLGPTPPIELRVHLYLLLTLVGVSWLLGGLVLPRLFPGWNVAAYWAVAGAVALLDSLAGLAHELGHAVVAVARGGRVYRITLYGLAAAAYRSIGQGQPREQLSIALAGPIGQLLIASALLLLWRLTPIENEAMRVATGWPALSNLLMGAANLLPLNPLDGHRVATALAAVGLRSCRL